LSTGDFWPKAVFPLYSSGLVKADAVRWAVSGIEKKMLLGEVRPSFCKPKRENYSFA
jgi:hypothetical protein